MNTPKNNKTSVSQRGTPQSENHPQTATPRGIEKEIGYAYASSLTAKRLGFYKTGCYYVSLIPPMTPGRVGGKGEEKLLQGFDTKAEAIAHANLMLPGVKYSRWSIQNYKRI